MNRVRNAAAPPARRRTVTSRPKPAAETLRPPIRPDQVMLLHGNWKLYQALDTQLTGTGVSVTYFQGIIEIMSISPLHERIKSNIGRLIDAYCLHRGIAFSPCGGPTHKQEDRAGEPDESFIFERGRTLPQLVIEVCITSGGMDKLPFWAGWAIEEVWVWKRGRIHFFRWHQTHYVEQKESTLVPGLKAEWIERFAKNDFVFDMLAEFKTLL
jgi:Uma2 family endonuclease